jgi:hypothetical protein
MSEGDLFYKCTEYSGRMDDEKTPLSHLLVDPVINLNFGVDGPTMNKKEIADDHVLVLRSTYIETCNDPPFVGCTLPQGE